MKVTQILYNTQLQKYDRWLKKLESSKATAKQIKQHTSNTKGAAQINVLRHNCTSLPTKNKKAVKNQTQVKVPSHSNCSIRNSQNKTNLMIEIQISVLDVVIPHMHQDLIAQQRSTNANSAPKLDTSLKCASPKMHTHSHSTIIKVSPNRHIKSLYQNKSTDWYKNTQKCDDNDFMIAFQLHAQPQKNVHNQNVTAGYTQKCLYGNIPYRLQPYHRHKYLCVQLNTCADVNLMPESVYKLVFNDPYISKLAKNDIDLTVYTRHSVDLIGKCTFYMLSKDTKQPAKVDFYITKEEGSVPCHERQSSSYKF